MNTTVMEKYFLTMINTPVTPYNASTEQPDIETTFRKIHQSQLFIAGLLFLLLVILAVMSVKLYKKIFSLCVPLAYPGAIPLQDEDIEEVVVYSNDVEELAAPIYHVEVDAQNNVITEEYQAFKKNK